MLLIYYNFKTNFIKTNPIVFDLIQIMIWLYSSGDDAQINLDDFCTLLNLFCNLLDIFRKKSYNKNINFFRRSFMPILTNFSDDFIKSIVSSIHSAVGQRWGATRAPCEVCKWWGGVRINGTAFFIVSAQQSPVPNKTPSVTWPVKEGNAPSWFCKKQAQR